MSYDKEEKQQHNPNYTPQGEEKLARDWAYKRYNQMKDAPERQRMEKKWDKYLAQWESLREEKDRDEWQSNHRVPLTTAIVETVLSEVIDQSPRPIIMPRGTEDAPKARVMSKIFDYTWETGDGDIAVYDILKDAFILGTGIGQEYYWREARKVYNDKGKEETVYDFDDVYLEPVRLQDFYVDEKARGFTGPFQARDAVRRYVMDIDDFHSIFDNSSWDTFKNAKIVVPGGDVNQYEFFKPPTGFDNGKDVEVLWYWSRKPHDCLYIVANDVLIFKGPNPYKHKQLPFARAVDVKRTHMFYGKGESELLESINDELDTYRQMMIDRNHLDIDKMFFVSPYLNLSDEDLMARPHGAIPADDVNGAKAIEYGDIPRSVELGLKHLEDDSVISTGINPRAQALPQSGTATEAAILKESTLKRIRLKMKLFYREFLTPIARMRVANILQYYSQPKFEKIIGDAGTQDYKNEVAKLKQDGLVEEINGEAYAKNWKQLRTEDTAFDFSNKDGKMSEVSRPGFNFFPLKPEYFMPVASGGYDIRFEAGTILPPSKSLMKEEMSQLTDRILNVAMAMPGSYDPVKTMDQLIRVNDRNPADFKPKEIVSEENRIGQQLDLAALENQQMMQGVPVETTPYASPAHTQVHVEYVKSPEFQQQVVPGDPRLQMFIDHVTGEVVAQETRAMGGAAMGMQPQNGMMPQGQGMPGVTAPGGTPPAMGEVNGQMPQPKALNGANKQMQQMMPDKIQGGMQSR